MLKFFLILFVEIVRLLVLPWHCSLMFMLKFKLKPQNLAAAVATEELPVDF